MSVTTSIKDTLKFRNVVCNCQMSGQFNIEYIVEAFHGIFDNGVFPACVSICRETETTNSIFKSGQIVTTGGKDKYQALASAYYCVDKIRRDLDSNTRLYNHQVTNIVASGLNGFRLNLRLFYETGEDTDYKTWDPSIFPGLTWVTFYPRIVFVIYDTGAVVITGMRDPVTLNTAAERIKVLKLFKVGTAFNAAEYAKYEQLNKLRARQWIDKQDQNGIDIESEAPGYNKKMKKQPNKNRKDITTIKTEPIEEAAIVVKTEPIEAPQFNLIPPVHTTKPYVQIKRKKLTTIHVPIANIAVKNEH